MPKLGIHNGKEYWLEKETVYWRVPDLRECVRARPGWVILGSDFSQIEVKLMAYYSGDEFLIGAINSGKDIHSYMTCEIFDQELSLALHPDPETRYSMFMEIIDGKVKSELKDDYKEMRTGVKRVTFNKQ